MIDAETAFGFCPAGSVGAAVMVHCVSLITPNFQGSAHVDEAPINIVKAKTNVITVLKQNILFICRFISNNLLVKVSNVRFMVVCQNRICIFQHQLPVT